MDIIIGLLIGNILAILSWPLITTPIAVDTRLSLYTYLKKIAGGQMSKLYDWANVLIFTVISAAMVTVSATAVRFAFDIPAQLNWYPTNFWFDLIIILTGTFVVFVAISLSLTVRAEAGMMNCFLRYLNLYLCDFEAFNLRIFLIYCWSLIINLIIIVAYEKINTIPFIMHSY